MAFLPLERAQWEMLNALLRADSQEVRGKCPSFPQERTSAVPPHYEERVATAGNLNGLLTIKF
jgi:hypothetical protein